MGRRTSQTMEFLLAPSLDWRMLRTTTSVAGKVVGNVIATRVVLGEPDKNLFIVPNDAKVEDNASFNSAVRKAPDVLQ